MRKYLWIAVIALIASAVYFTSCERIPKEMMDTIMPDAEPVEEPTEPEPVEEMVETMEPEPTEMMEPTEVVEPPVETPPEMEPEMPEEPVVVEPTTPAIEGPVVSVSPAQIASPAVGEQLQVSIQIAQVADIIGYELSLGFDPTALKYVSGSLADYLPAGAFPIVTASTNEVFFGGASVSGPASASSGTLATVTFEVVAAEASTLTLSEVLLYDSEGEITPTTVDGEISAP